MSRFEKKFREMWCDFYGRQPTHEWTAKQKRAWMKEIPPQGDTEAKALERFA